MLAKKSTKKLNSCPNTHYLIPWQLNVVTFEISNCDFCYIKLAKFNISKVYNIWVKRWIRKLEFVA